MLGAIATTALLALAASAGAQPTAHASIVGGVSAPAGSWPWAAFVADLQGDSGMACTATVVAPRVVLTAAHCATDTTVGDYRVVTGSLDWANAATRQVSNVTQLATFPFWNPTERYGDAAVLILSTPTTAPAISMATLNDVALLRTGRSVSLAGWGQRNINDQQPPTALLAGTIQLQSPGFCDEHAAELSGRFEPAGMVCALDSHLGAVGACHGDSGGPLVAMRADQTPVQVGITSAGEERCIAHFPGFFTRVDLVSNWVNAWIAAIAAAPGSDPITPPAVPETSDATPPLGELTTREATRYVRPALGARVRGARGYRSRCGQQSASSVQCRVSWSRQGRAYAGVVRVFLRFDKVERLVVVAAKAKTATRRTN